MSSIVKAFDLTGKTALITGGSRGLRLHKKIPDAKHAGTGCSTYGFCPTGGAGGLDSSGVPLVINT